MNISRINIYRLFILIITALYCLVVFLAVPEYTESFWILFAFTIVVFVIALLTTFLKSDGRIHLAEKLYFIRIPIFYLAVQLLLHLLLLIPSLNYVVVLIIEIFFSLAVVAFTLFRLMHTSVISDNLTTQRKQVQYLAKLEACIVTCEEEAADEQVKLELHKLAERIRYSDYNSGNEVSDIENQMVILAVSITDQEPQEQLNTIKKLNILLTQRNKMVLLLK